MNTYKVIGTRLVWYETFIRADSEDEAEEIALEDQTELDWQECGFGAFEIEDIAEVGHD